MAILITQARFTPQGPKDTTAAPEDRVEAARKCSIFQAPSYGEAAPALAAAAARRGLADLRTVLVTSGGISRTPSKRGQSPAAIRPAGAGVADLPAAERRVDDSWLLFFFVGLLAQLVDGALGMAFG